MLRDPTRFGPVARAFAHGLVQPDQKTCGSAVLVMARMINDPAYAEYVLGGTHPVTGLVVGGSVRERFGAEAAAMLRRTNLPVDVSGRLQVPWPRQFGTLPWAVARQMHGPAGSGVPGTTYDVTPVLPHRRDQAFARTVAAVAAGHVVPLFVGNRWLARHVVLVVAGDDQRLRVYDPAAGRRVDLSRDDFVAGRLGAGGWPVPWFVVLPSGRAAGGLSR